MTDYLNKEQKFAVEHIEGPALVLAGAGSGKTRVITYRIAHLLKMGVPAAEILAVTFTNKAAQEMRNRIEKISQNFVLTCTFHSLCAKILRESIPILGYKKEFTIYDEEDSEKLLKQCLVALNLQDEKGLLKTIRTQISSAKNNLLSPDHFLKEKAQLSALYSLYQSKLKEYQALDFDDLLFLTVKLFQNYPEYLERYQKQWNFILIDEYQDTNIAQHTLIRLLALKHDNIFAVGDPDQSIYSWRGACLKNILEFEKEFPGAKVILLEQNYRSRSNILSAANYLISKNPNRYEKKLWSVLGEGQKIRLSLCENERQEAEFVVRSLLKYHRKENIPLKESVIFYRTNFQSRPFEDALLRQKIPYVIIGGLSFYQRKEIKDILALLRMVLGGSDFLSFARTINTPKRGLGESALAKIKECAETHRISILEAACAITDQRIHLKLSTKQLEGLKSYVDIILSLQEMVKNNAPLHEIISEAISCSSYLDHLREDLESFEERRQNVSELIAKAAEWDQDLAGFLEELSLKSAQDIKETSEDSVRLMTLHHGKGLEFTLVFLVGMEEDLFPHLNSKDNEETLQEERRLCYVGMTRAKEYLYLTACTSRFLWGISRPMRPSRFLSEIPKELIHSFQPSEEEREEDPPLEFTPGESVYHRDFGRGTVQKTYHTSLGLTYDIFFPASNNSKSLVAKYAKLTRVN